MKGKIILIILIGLLPGISFAGGLRGHVFDFNSNDKLIGATITIKGTTIGAVSDLNGYYEIPSIKPGEYTFVANYIGYEPNEITLTIGADDKLKHDFHLVSTSENLMEVTVSVQAKGQISALNQQLNSDYISNVVAAERLQELPDATAAASLARIPGITVKSDNGEGSTVVIRGMDSRYNLVTIGGVRAPSGDPNENSVGLAGVSPFMIDGIEVQKSLTPDKDADVVGGIVDLKLKDADEGFNVNAVFQNNFNTTVESNWNPRTTLQLSNRFFDNKLGVVLVGNYEDIDRSSERMGAWGVRINKLDASDDVVVDLRDGQFYSSDFNRKRYGGSLFMDYKLSLGSIKFSSFMNGLANDELRRTLSYNNRVGTMRRNVNATKSNNFSIVNSLKFEHNFVWNSKIEVGAAYTKATSKTPENYSLNSEWLTPSNYDPSQEPEEIGIIKTQPIYPYDIATYANYLTDSSYFISHLGSTDNVFTEDAVTAQVDWTIPVTFTDQISGSFKVGGKYRSTNRDYDANDRGTSLTGGDGPDVIAFLYANNPDIDFGSYPAYVGNGISTLNLLDDYDKQILDGQFNHRGFVERGAMEQIIQSLDNDKWSASTTAYNERRNLPNDYKGSEQVIAAYGMFDLNLSKYLQFVGGVRMENYKTDYRSFGIYEAGIIDFQIEEFGDSMAVRKQNYILPMGNVKIKPFDWMNIRLAYSQSIARPRYYSYMPRYKLSRLKELSNIGNPALTPALSHNIDAYVSFKANKLGPMTGLLTIGAFYKKIEGYEYTKTWVNIHDSVNNVHPYNVISDNRNAPINMAINNPHDSYSKGVEIDWQGAFIYLPSPFNGITLSANYTYNTTEQTQIVQKVEKIQGDQPWIIETKVSDSTFTAPLFYQPKHTVNASIGYDYKGFSARLGFNMTSEAAIGYVDSGRDFTENFKYAQARKVWDLSVTQKVPKVKGLQLFFNMTNIGNTFNKREIFYRTDASQPEFPMFEEYFGRISIVGIRYTM